jgi:triacylglycerol lipase
MKTKREPSLVLSLDNPILDDETYHTLTDFQEIRLSHQPEFDPEIAMELGNLTRVAYQDYENYEIDQTAARFLLEKNRYLDIQGIRNSRAAKYKILDKEGTDQRLDDPNLYQILDVFYYTSYNFLRIIPEIYNPNTSRFGFIAKQGNRIFVVFRGTREGEEWFNNIQPHHIEFFRLERKKIENSPPNLRVHWGFHKIYTKFHPGPFLRSGISNIPNIIFSSPGMFYRWLTEIFSGSKAPHKIPSIYEVIEEVFENVEYYSLNYQVFVTGHSLGGSLATLAAFQIGNLANKLQNCQRKPILYTFASPRVGNSGFAKDFNRNVDQAFRIANSEDVVPNFGSAAIKFFGLEMTKASVESQRDSFPQKINKRIRKSNPWSTFMNFITSGLYEEGYEHVGKPVIFTWQTRCISSNHNMNAVYCGVVENHLRENDGSSATQLVSDND